MWTLKKKRKRRALERLAGASAEALALVRALGSREAEALVRALACPQQRGPCVRVAGCPQQQQRRPPGGCASACAHLRWPDLPPAAALRPLPPPACASRPCCNPYHWSRLCGPESPPPPYCRFAADEEAPSEDRAPSEDSRRTERERPDPGSLATDGEDRSGRGSREWCRLAYWEMSDRVGPQYRVDIPSVNVFSAIPQGQGLCLDRLARDAVRPGRSAPDDDSVVRTRAKIGLGVTLSLEEDGVWVYNRSEQPVFVNSPTLDDLESRTYLVYRVPPGHCLCVFDPAKAGERPAGRRGRFGSPPAGPVDPNSVRISFAKGWGPKYTRQDVTACPCWLEVLLEPCR